MKCVLPWNKIKPLAILPFTSTGILSRKVLVNWFSLEPPMRITFLLPAKQNAKATLQNNEYAVFENRYPAWEREFPLSHPSFPKRISTLPPFLSKENFHSPTLPFRREFPPSHPSFPKRTATLPPFLSNHPTSQWEQILTTNTVLSKKKQNLKQSWRLALWNKTKTHKIPNSQNLHPHPTPATPLFPPLPTPSTPLTKPCKLL